MEDRDLSFYNLGDITDLCVLALVRVYDVLPEETDSDEERIALPVGYVLVIDPSRFDPLWKLPGGHAEAGETPLCAIIREVGGETGLSLSPERFGYGGKWLGPHRDHWKLLFVADATRVEVDEYMGTDQEGNEGEVPRFFSVREFQQMAGAHKMVPDHHNQLVARGFVFPPGRGTGSAA